MNKTILVVDDDPEMRLSVRRVLRHQNYSVVLAGQAQEALHILAEQAPASHPIDLIITDLCMPGMDGLELLLAVKKISKRLPIIFITAYGTVPNAIAALKAGASDYLLKPFSNAQLLKTVEDELREQSGVWQDKTGAVHQKLEVPPRLSHSELMQEVWSMVERVAGSGATVLIQGESGVGKEVVARHIHLLSPRRDEPFVAINCAAIPENLLESELFGFVKGSFTGATMDKQGKFSIVGRGTLLLDEVSEMPFNLQSKLLRVLQEKEFFQIGGRTPIKMEARIIATTNRDLNQWMKEGHFREDLYYRLHVIPIVIPPLRERRQDIELLAEYFIEQFNVKNPHYPVKLSEDARDYLLSLYWPGNVRQLENGITRVALLAGHPLLTADDCKKYLEATVVAPPENDRIKTLEEIETEVILKTLRRLNGNRTQTAEALGISSRTLRNKLDKLKEQGLALA